jgi:uncharacterized protein (TIGR00251 family)
MKTVLLAEVTPNSREFEIKFDSDKNALKIRTTKPPDKGKANAEIEKTLTKLFKAKTTIIKGKQSKKKIIEVQLEKKEVLKKLNANL